MLKGLFRFYMAFGGTFTLCLISVHMILAMSYVLNDLIVSEFGLLCTRAVAGMFPAEIR